ncbi:hypothetical protein [Streptomyces pseudovenezuelae]|uniref:hypothetical protein n=1 Tax=Streptomyces pseudovenezuelae TaxID=67350 RepID=UPI0036E8F283
MTDTANAIAEARKWAESTWATFLKGQSGIPDAGAGPWQEGTLPDGTPHLSAEMTGSSALEALHRFAADTMFFLGDGDTRPAFDYSVPGRTACVWRSRGVWVELWVPDTPNTPVAPAQAVRRRLLARPGARLPFTRNRRTAALKETTTS